MTSREKFEAWVSDNGKFQRALECKGGIYLLATINTQWEAWQAASEASEQQLLDMSVQLANAESKCRELAAENVTLNDKMNKLATWPGIEFYSSAWAFCNLDGNDALEFMCDVKTPATDAYLKGVGE